MVSNQSLKKLRSSTGLKLTSWPLDVSFCLQRKSSTHITKAADRKRPQEGGFLGCFEKPPVSYFPAQKLTWKLKNDPLKKGSSFTHYPFFGFRFNYRRCIWGRNTCILWKTFWVSLGGWCFTFASILSNTVDGPHFAVEKGLHSQFFGPISNELLTCTSSSCSPFFVEETHLCESSHGFRFFFLNLLQEPRWRPKAGTGGISWMMLDV